MMLVAQAEVVMIPWVQALSSLGGLAIVAYLAFRLPDMVKSINEAMSKEREYDRICRRDHLSVFERTNERIVGAIKDQTTELRTAISGGCRYTPRLEHGETQGRK